VVAERNDERENDHWDERPHKLFLLSCRFHVTFSSSRNARTVPISKKLLSPRQSTFNRQDGLSNFKTDVEHPSRFDLLRPNRDQNLSAGYVR
jgi:hypothetical protein